MWQIYWLILMYFFYTSVALLCYNCSTTHRDWSGCGGEFAPTVLKFYNTRKYLVNCTGENSMCFVRSWSARAQHMWMVQRGCYLPAGDDPLPGTVTTPTRAMTCKQERLPDAEYRVCLCKADWCNSATSNFSNYIQFSCFATMCIFNLSILFINTYMSI